jgi:hypothetical protein
MLAAAEFNWAGMDFALPIARRSRSKNPSKDETAESRRRCKIDASANQ